LEPMPKPLLKQLILTTLVGTGCFIVGSAFYFTNKDILFLALSALIFLFSLCKTASLYYQIKRHCYVILEGRCLDIQPKLLGRCKQVLIEDAHGCEIQLILDKDLKMQLGDCYRFYFKADPGNHKEKQLLTDNQLISNNLLGMESINETELSTNSTIQS